MNASTPRWHRAPGGGPAAAALVSLRCGTRDDPPGGCGTAHILEHLVFQGTRSAPTGAAVAGDFERLGVRFNAFTGRELSGLYALGDGRAVRAALPLLLEAVAEPTLTEEGLAHAKAVVALELRQRAGRPQRHLRELAMSVLVGDHPAGRTVAGRGDEVAALTVDDVRAFWRRWAAASTTLLITGGDVDEAAVTGALSGVALPDPPVAAAVAPAGSAAARGGYVVVGSAQVAMAVVFPGASYLLDRRDILVARILSTLFGGMRSSRLALELRQERQWCYETSSTLECHADFGALLGICMVAPADAARCADTVVAVLTALADDGPTPDELDRATAQLRSAYALEWSSGLDQVQMIARDLHRRGSLVGYAEFRELVDSIGVADVRRLAARLLEAEPSVVAFGPAEGLAVLRDGATAAKGLEECAWA